MIRTIGQWALAPMLVAAVMMFSGPQEAQAQGFGFSIGGPRGGSLSFYSAPNYYRGFGPYYRPSYRVPSYRYSPRYYSPRYDSPRYTPRYYAPRYTPRYYTPRVNPRYYYRYR